MARLRGAKEGQAHRPIVSAVFTTQRGPADVSDATERPSSRRIAPRESASSHSSKPHHDARGGVEGGKGFREVPDIGAEDRQPDRQEPNADEIKGEAGRQKAARRSVPIARPARSGGPLKLFARADLGPPPRESRPSKPRWGGGARASVAAVARDGLLEKGVAGLVDPSSPPFVRSIVRVRPCSMEGYPFSGSSGAWLAPSTVTGTVRAAAGSSASSAATDTPVITGRPCSPHGHDRPISSIASMASITRISPPSAASTGAIVPRVEKSWPRSV